ncbi:oligosaccharide flippase family protein [Methylosinus sp. LW4]|uniref:oligosaccharide flippase family protein n=1 Tax=Methylosinus sp. LW4 TaxID=136993 RepID=UPI0003A4EE6A|nr:oligosaccharide flippase family protein [Methylosinus sp. LW4]
MNRRSLEVNFVINILGSIAPLFISLVTVPLYMRQIGDSRYGVMSIVWVMLGYFGFLDLGLSRAAANSLSRLKDNEADKRGNIIVTGLILNIGMGVLGSLLLATTGGYLLSDILRISDELRHEVAIAFPWIVCLFPLALLSGFGIGVIESRENFLIVNIIQFFGTAAGQILPIVLAFLVDPSLAVVIPAAVISRGVCMLVLLLAAFRGEGFFGGGAFDALQAKKLLSYGGWVSASSIIGPILLSFDQFVIGAVLGVATIPLYAIPMSLVSRGQIFAGALIRTLFPRISSLSNEDARILSFQSLSFLLFGYGAVCAAAMVLSPAFFSKWISNEFAASAVPVVEILFVGAWVNGIAYVPYGLLQGRGRPDITAKCHIIELIPFIVIISILTSVFGIIGAAVAWSLRCAIDALLLLYAARMFNLKTVLDILIVLAVLVLSAVFSQVLGDRFAAAFGSAIVLFFGTAAIGGVRYPVVVRFMLNSRLRSISNLEHGAET